jgi:hypothetical protein
MLLFSGTFLRVTLYEVASVPAEPAACDFTPKLEAAVSHLSPRLLYFDRLNQAISQTTNTDGTVASSVGANTYVYMRI